MHNLFVLKHTAECKNRIRNDRLAPNAVSITPVTFGFTKRASYVTKIGRSSVCPENDDDDRPRVETTCCFPFAGTAFKIVCSLIKTVTFQCDSSEFFHPVNVHDPVGPTEILNNNVYLAGTHAHSYTVYENNTRHRPLFIII